MAKITTAYADRDVQYPNRYTLTNVSGTTYDVVRAEGTVNVAGTLLNKTILDEIKITVNGLDDYRIADETSISNLNTGWIPASETWTYSSVDDPTGVITISGDKTTKYSLGMRIKFTNGGNTIYGIITKISYSSPNTTLTFLHEINPTNNLALYLMANSAITANYYSNMKVPFGFPANPDSWSVKLLDTSTPTQNNPTQNTWYNLGTLSLTIPIGVWCTRYDAQTEHERASAGYPSVYCALSTNNNSVSDVDLQTQGYFYSALVCSLVLSRDKILNLTSKTVYYLIAKTDQASCTYLKFRGSLSTTKIKAVCAYL